ncbi:2-dehydro-3-deoxy-phosphogluconate aldolase [Ahrensia sp. 13_GOM-1096m]|uniref:2-dehydro-3-deoxy-phosphogluconate aldolase n=1 Tax=Ahrensia sp. 13_GOM-1096m TaxID=1380380 RepID=UPI000478CCF6|nr:2-dehydro-3-deoxy-phosphogluconate aldolase [Ahrensia sp. 13_GOM-1096m]
MAQNVDALIPVMTGQKVIPVIVLDNADDAVPLARALAAGGLPAVEITLRTAAALECIKRVAAEVPEAIVGAGTILNGRNFDEAVAAGSKFIVSPGLTPELVSAANGHDVPLLPGSVTSSEIMSALEAGYTHLKFFPAEQAGGAAYLKSCSTVFGQVKFCPTGGVSVKNANDYLSLPNVLCVGGSWVAPKDMITSGDWDGITALAKAAAGI